MRIGIFVVTVGKNAGGPEVYERNLVNGLAAIDRENEYHLFCPNRRAAESFNIRNANFTVHVLQPRIRWVSFSLSLPLAVARRDLDFLHATFTPPPLMSRPLVFTHHCFSTFVHKEFYDPVVLMRLNPLIVSGIRNSRLCVCVSKNVRDLTSEKFGIPHERMPVVYNGISPVFQPVEEGVYGPILKERYGIDFPYFLYVGKIQDRKNILRMLAAYHRFTRQAGTDTRLVIVGRRSGPLGDMDGEILRRRLAPYVHEFEYVQNTDLPVFYSGARAFLFPSLWEGFGIPVIEAMACGTPVITSNLSSLPEVSGDAALLVDPYDVDDIAAAIYRVHADAHLREDLIRAGRAQAARFSWENTARQTLGVYRRMRDL